MPSGDGNGPAGRGPMTGKGMGYCPGRAPYGGSRQLGLGAGRGIGGGHGRGFGAGAGRCVWSGNRFVPGTYKPMSIQEERDLLRSEESQLNENLQDIKNMLSRLEANKQD